MSGSSDGASERLDRVLVARGLVTTRTRAQALCLAGRVRSGERRLDKPGQRVPWDLPLEIVPGPAWVSRAGHKLAGALDRLAPPVAGRDVLDVGASTGGFTEVLLRHGAHRVIALDVGRGQLDWSLRNDPRVHVLEGLNARHLEPGWLPYSPALAVVDVSFISLRLILPAVAGCLTDDGEMLALIKPQFEVGRGNVERGGLVRDPERHREVLREFLEFSHSLGWARLGLCSSSLPGARGNREFFLHLRPRGGVDLDAATCERWIDEAVGGDDEARA